MKKRFWFVLFAILLILSLSLISSLEQKNAKKEFFPIFSIQIKTNDVLNKRYNTQFDITYEDTKSSPQKVLGEKITFGNKFESMVKNTNEEDIVRRFLNENQDKLKIEEKSLYLRKIERDPGIIPEQDSIKYISFTQEYNKIPIFNSYVNFIMINDNINSLNANYFDGLNIEVTPKISSDKAIDIIKENLNISNPYFSVENISLIIFPIKSNGGYDYILTWMVSLFLIKEKQSSLVSFINSDNGEIVYSYDRVKENTLSGFVSGEVYEKNPLILKKEKYFKNNYVYLNNLTNLHYYSGKGNNLNNSLVLRNRISLANKKNIRLEFSTKYDLEINYDYVLLYISSDNGLTWDTLAFFNGQSNGWINKSINLSYYSESNILLKFSYTTDFSVILDGFFLDNIKIIADNNLIFYDNAENNSSPWVLNGFYKTGEIGNVLLYQTTDKNGFYNFSNLVNNSVIRSELNGPYVDVNIFNGNDSEFLFSASAYPSNLNWSWKDYDMSYKQEESNAFYHVNEIHDYFIDHFNITSMNYQTKATLEYPGFCNAFSDGIDIYLFGAGGGCEDTALSSAIIYHEYTHTVIDHIYYPYYLRSDMHEAFADYFASTILDTSLVGEGIWPEPIRDLKNSNRFPVDITGEPHYDSLILSGALWDLRFDLGKEYTDKLVMSSIKASSNSYQDVLENMLVLDDNNGYLYDGTTHILSICHAFLDNHGIYSPYCVGHTQYPILKVDSPTDNENLYGNIVQIKGTIAAAADGYIQKYTLEYNDGTNWIIIKESWNPINDGILGLWDISSVPKGEYTLRLKVIDNYGNVYIEDKKIYRDIPNINKASIICQNSPCVASSNMIKSRDNIFNVSELNQPNTFTNCQDGSFGQYLVDESIENITVVDLNNTQFLVGDTVNVDIWTYCWGAYADYLRIKYTSDTVTPDWNLKYLDYCNSTGFMKFSYKFKLDNRIGYHAIRGMFGYYFNNINDDCDGGFYSDNDDVVILVKDISPPTVSLISPGTDSIFNLRNINFEFRAEDNINLSSCEISVYKINGESTLIRQKDENNLMNNGSVNFTFNDLESGDYLWKVECKDTSNNSGFSENRIFSINADKIKINIQNGSFVNISKIFLNISLIKKVDSLKYSDNGKKFLELCKNCNNFSGYLKLGYGSHKLNFNASSLDEKEIVFFVDTTAPQISATKPISNKFTNRSNFYIRYTEENLKEIILSWNPNMTKTTCSSGKNQECYFDINLSGFDGQIITYTFIVTDIAENTASKSVKKVNVDTAIPKINSFESWIFGRYRYFNISITESNLDEVTYSYYDSRGRLRDGRLCSRLRDGKCVGKVSLSGKNITQVKVIDKAGNYVEKSV